MVVGYCGKEHQKSDWEVHKKICVSKRGPSTSLLWGVHCSSAWRQGRTESYGSERLKAKDRLSRALTYRIWKRAKFDTYTS